MPNQIEDTFLDSVIQPLVDAGLEIARSPEDLKRYAAESMARLSTLVGQTGYDRAVEAERDIVAIKVGLRLVDNASLVDMQRIGIIEGALRFGAGLLSGGAL